MSMRTHIDAIDGVDVLDFAQRLPELRKEVRRALQAIEEDVLDDIGLVQFDSPSTPNRLTSAAAGRGRYKDVMLVSVVERGPAAKDLHALVAPTVDDAIRATITNHKALVAAAGSDFDVLLGNDWLNEHEAVMSYQDKTLSLACDKSEPVVLPCPSAGVSQSGQSAVSNPASFLVNALRAKPPLASAKVAARWLRKGGTGVLALITVDNSSTPDPAPAEPDLPPGVSQALNALLDEYADVFAPITSLPPERPVGHAIPLVPDARPSVVPQYRMSQDEHAELKKQVQDLLAKGMIEPSSSPFAAPILFVKKKSGELRMCLDYRQLNKITIRDQYPLPRIDDLFDKLSGCTVFSSLDLQAGYNQIRITPEDVPKTAFRTPDGHYQFKVLSFGLCNAPATFQRVMNDAFAPVLNQCALVYLDDILVMSKSVDEHLKHLRKVFDLLRLNKLYAKQSKCEFMRTTLKFLGHVIFAGAIAVDPEKIKSISSWPVPQSLQQLQSFLGAANFVRKFVHNFSVLAAPLTDLCGKAGDSFLWHNWPADELKAFASLKAAVAQVPMLRLPDHTQPFQVYCDASLQGVGAVLMQDGYPLAYLSKKLSSAERNYTTGEQELLALITACKEWRCYLEGVPFTLFTDHKPLTALPTQKVLSRRQARWMEFLSRFTFDLQYLPGDANPADPLSRIPAGPQDCAMVCVVTTRRQAKQSLERGEVRVAQALPQVPPVGTPSNAPTAVDALAPRPTVSDNPVAAHHSRLPELEAPSAADTSVHYPAAPAHPLELADHLVHGYRLDPAFTAEADLSGMYMDDHGLWRRTGKGTVMVPNDPELREYILHEMHDAAYAGHVGITKTIERLSRVFYWDTMRADVRHYVTTCDACQRDKSSTLKPGGLLNPLSIPDYRWESVSMDLITKLPSASHGFDAICVFVDRLSKMVHFVPCKESMNAKGFARLFVDNVFKLHGLPKDMVSNRGPHFHNTFWHHVQKLLGMRGSLSSSYHPQSDGQTERYNRVLEEMLRHYISPTQADWPDYLSLAEFAVNNSWQESIKSTPFLVNTGQSPITPMLHSLPDKGRCPEGLSYATWWQEAVAKAKLCMQAAQQRQAAYANQDRRDVHYKVGQMVLLSTKNMRLKPGKARKLLPRFVGPFKVLDLVGQVAVNLQLPASMSRLHPVFHVSLIKPYTGTDVGFMPPPVEWLDEEPVYYVERLLDHRHVHAGKAKEYLVQWEGYDADHNTWEPRSNLVGCDKILAEYNAAHNLKKIMMEPLRVLTATNQPVVITERRCGLLEVQKSKTNCNAVVMPGMLNGVDLILGVDWMHEHDAVLKVKHGVCTLFEALGESSGKEQWESAAEIKLLSPGQAVRQLRKGCSSWLMLVKPGDAGDQEGWHQGSLAAAVAGCSEQSTMTEQDPWLVPQAVLDGLLSEYADVFGDMPPGLPPNRPVGHTIRTPPGAEAPYKRMYKLSPREEAEVKKQVAELLANGLIEPSSSPYGAPILFVQKKDGSLRMCIDYRALNKLTVRDRYPLPRIDDLFDKLAGKRVFSSLDLQSGYHQIRITEEDVPKTAFLTPMGQFQLKVLCFGLTNAPATFQRMMNNVFKPLINECVLVYIDDILVMSNTPEEHVQHLRQVLQLMRENKFYAKLAKCEFNKTQLAFLGHIVGSKGIAVDPAKVQVVKEWPTPRNLKDLQAFLGLANYFRRFISNFSSLAAPLTNLTSKQVAAAYDWEHFGGAELEAFNALKETLCSALVLALPDFSKPFVVCTDASLVGTGGVLMQDGRPIAYTSKKMSPAETRYATGEQELLGIIRAVREWRCYLDGAVDVTILTDHNPLIYLQTQPNLSRRQVRWMEELSRYKYEIKYIPGATNVADPISRNPALANEVALTSSSSPQNADSEDAMTVIMTLSSRAERPIYAITTRRTAARLRENAELGQVAAREAAQRANQLAIKQAYAADKRFADEAFTSQLPDDAALRKKVIYTMHDTRSAGHLGMTKTLEQVTRWFTWPGVSEDVKSYVRSCHSCQVNKSSAKKPAGLLQPLPIPERPWDSVSMDLIVKLPASGPNKYDSILVFVDRLTKMVHLVKTWESMTATQYAKLFLEHVFRLHGMPRSVVSDRGPQFHNKFWAEVTKLLQVQVNLSSAYHPETDGQTERVNRVIEEMLRHFIRPDQRDWAEYLPLVEFAINNAWQESVRSTPFYLNYGYHPRLAELLDLPQKVPQAHDFVKGMKTAVEQARQCLARAQKRMKSYQDNKRREALYLPGDMVLLSTQNMRGKANQPGVRKLKPRYVGPFSVQYMVGKAAVKLWLPDEWSRLHNVFHVSLVKPYRTDASGAVPGLAGPPPVQWLDGEPQYTVEKVVGHRLEPNKGKRKGKCKKRRLEFLVKWQGHGDEHNTWELSPQLVGCQELLARYLSEHNLSAEAEEAADGEAEAKDDVEPRPDGRGMIGTQTPSASVGASDGTMCLSGATPQWSAEDS
ncbi:hypothetical protein QJQ45_015781 [Haematococcus lacustris]|nr:hypothetical protein QJQ45_015781 [Haematococcus lacustris]